MRLYRIGLVFFILFWVVFIMLDYWQKHPYYSINLSHYQYYDLLGLLGILGAGFTLGVLQVKKREKLHKFVNGFSLFGSLLVLLAISVQYFISKNSLNTGEGSILHLLGLVAYSSLSTYAVVFIAYVLGDFFHQLFPTHIPQSSKTIISIALGIMGIVGILFLVGAMGLLQWYVVLPIFALIAALKWKSSFAFLKKTLISPIKLSDDLNILGIVSAFILLVTVGWTILQINVPFPRGWDALSLYAALPTLINDYKGLINGYQPYNWSLLMSLGFILFNKLEVVLLLSYAGGLLSFFAIYELARSVFKMNTNYSLLAMTFFSLLPSIGFQSIHDQKVDLGLLFIMLAIVLVFVNWIKDYTTNNENKHEATRLVNPYIALMGLLTGFALGVKLTTLFIFFGVLAAVWFVLNGKWGFLAIFALSMFGILLLRLDEQSGLRAYHLSAGIVQWMMLVAGIGFSYLAFQQNKAIFIKGVRYSIVYGLFFLLPVLPWLCKNYIEARSLDVTSLLNGKSNAPNGSIQSFTKNYDRSK